MQTIVYQSALAFGAGVILNFMPCVLPVMPFKVQALLRETTGTTRSRALAAAALLAGSLVFFVVLGAVTAGFGLMWGQQFQHPWFRLLLSLFLFAAAAATFTGWSWRLPQFVYRAPMSRHLGAFFTGALAGVLSTPCSGPFLGSVLAFTATRSALETMAIFSAIGTGLAFPYVVFLLWPGLLARLSFSSGLAVHFKMILGFVLLAAGLFFVQGFLPPILRQAGWMMLVLGIGVWLVFRSTHGSRVGLRPILIVVLAFVVVAGFRDVSLDGGNAGVPWQAYSDHRLAQSVGQPVLVEFTADWCINCKALERTTFKNKKLMDIIDTMGIIPLQVDLTQVDDQRRELFDRFGGRAIPYIVVIDRQGQLVQRFTGMVSAETLVDIFKSMDG
ncbi:protein-disulfide reductase DsbD family protein [Desulfosarcina sp.]|uniref:protein-disulfide reductase DsbD family protein n=1 Tax=Desulfosarcina sp. TaxID=2027861 RepID=UPI003563676A